MRARVFALLAVVVLVTVAPAWSQEPTPTPSTVAPSAPPPTVIPVNGRLRLPGGEPRTGTVVLQLSLYAGREDATPMWVEDQQVTLDAAGHYDLYFGATRDDGLPAHLFAGGLARWLGVAVQGETEGPRTFVVGVPYAANAVAADTLGGKTADDFVLSENLRAILKSWGITGSTTSLENASAVAESDAGIQALSDWSGPSTPNAIVKWLDNQGTPGDSAMYESGGRVGIGTTSPQQALHIAKTTTPGDVTTARQLMIGVDGNPIYNLSLGYYFSGTQYSGVMQARDNGGVSPFLLNPQGGNVGIGTTSPQQVLHIAKATTAGDVTTARQLMIGVDGNPIYNLSLGYYFSGTQFSGVLQAIANGGVVPILLNPQGGNVGIGTIAPEEKLHVAGNVKVTGDLTAAGVLGAKYQDVAEWVEASEPLAVATVVTAHRTLANHVRSSTRAYDTAVLGVVSTQPGVLLGEPGDGKVAVAQSGRVKVKVDARYGAIRPGDLLVTSPIPGCAMRSRPTRAGTHRPGTIIGKALEGLPKGKGEILVLLTLQ